MTSPDIGNIVFSEPKTFGNFKKIWITPMEDGND